MEVKIIDYKFGDYRDWFYDDPKKYVKYDTLNMNINDVPVTTIAPVDIKELDLYIKVDFYCSQLYISHFSYKSYVFQFATIPSRIQRSDKLWEVKIIISNFSKRPC